MINLKSYHVYHHEGAHEVHSVVLATSRMQASESVEGEVMHVSEGESIYSGIVTSSSGWNRNTFTPQYKDKSDEWLAYLKKVNTGNGEED